MKKLVYILTAIVIFLPITSCSDNIRKSNNSGEAVTSAATETTDSLISDLSDPIFSYDTLNLPDEIVQASHLYSCYRDSNAKYLLLSVNSYNGNDIGVISKTESLALIDIEGNITQYEITTDAYITSAIPYNGSVIYVDWNFVSESSDVEWSILMTDGSNSKVVDSGKVDNYRSVPYLFLLDGKAYYLWQTDVSFGVNKIADGKVELLFEKSDCSLISTTEAHSNGHEFCFMAIYPDEENATFVICNSDGILYEYKIGGKITSYTITDRYAVCGVGDEDTRKFWIEAVDLSTGDAKTVSDTGVTWCLNGNGSDCFYVDDDWTLLYIDIENGKKYFVPNPPSNLLGTILVYSGGESKSFVLTNAYSDSSYALYCLTISR